MNKLHLALRASATAVALGVLIGPAVAWAHPEGKDNPAWAHYFACHATGSSSHPWQLINPSHMSETDYHGHDSHIDDIIADGGVTTYSSAHHVPVGTIQSEDDCPTAAAGVGGQAPEVPIAALYPALGAATFGAGYALRKLRRRAA